jgi:two-component system response regulator DevR
MGAIETEVAGNPVRVFLLDDHEMIRRGVQQLLDAEVDLEVVGEAATCAEAMDRVQMLRPQVAVLDVQLPDGDGLTLCRELRSMMPDLGCLMFTAFDDETALLAAIMAGASGYVIKQVNGADLLAAVRKVASGQSLIDASMVPTLLERASYEREADATKAQLSGPERQILQLIGERRTNQDIAKELSLTEETVKDRVSGMLEKLGFDPHLARASYWYHPVVR